MFIFKFSDEKIKLKETKLLAYQGLAQFHWPDKNNSQMMRNGNYIFIEPLKS